jgi:hypothetical protein
VKPKESYRYCACIQANRTMQQFNINLSSINRSARVYTAPFRLTVLNGELGDITVDSIPLKEYYVLADGYYTLEPTKHKVYKTVEGGFWYDKHFSEDAEFNSPEFGIPQINEEIKKAIDALEGSHAHTPQHIF